MLIDERHPQMVRFPRKDFSKLSKTFVVFLELQAPIIAMEFFRGLCWKDLGLYASLSASFVLISTAPLDTLAGPP